MDALDMKRHLKGEASACVFQYKINYHVSSLDVGDPEVRFIIYEPVPRTYYHGVIRTFNRKEEATALFEYLKADEPSPRFVIRPDGHFDHDYVEGGQFQVKYSAVFEKLQNWWNSYAMKKRTDVDLFTFLGKLGAALQYRYNMTGSFGNIKKDIVITDGGDVLFWNWGPGSKDFKTEFGVLKDFIQDISVLASKRERLDAFVSFISVVVGGAVPATDWQLLLIHYPIFMVEKQSLRFLEMLHQMLCNPAHGLSTTTTFKGALAKYHNKWKNHITVGSVAGAVMVFGRGYVGTEVELPIFIHNCVQHYKETAQRIKKTPLSQIEAVKELRKIKEFECLPEDLFEALYMGALALANNSQAANIYPVDKILDMLKVAEGESV